MLSLLRPPGDAAALRAAPDTPGCASHAKRWVLAAAILGSGIALLEASVINVALPAIQDSLSASVAELQGIASAYTLALASLALVSGAAGERLGKVRLFTWGAAGLALASLASGLATTPAELLAGRFLQGLASALLVPNSLALLSASFPRAERGRAIGIWSGATALIGAGGPVLGGWLVDVASWRATFFLVVPIALLTAMLAIWRVPDPPVLRRAPAIDWGGASLSSIGIAGLVAAIILAPVDRIAACGLAAVGVLALAGFALVERRTPAPMVPPRLLLSRSFVGVNLLTLLLYFAVTSTFFLIPFDLIQVQGYSATQAGAAFLPFAVVVGALSRWAGGLSDRFGPRPILILGSLVTAAGLALFALPGTAGTYASTFFAPMLAAGLGMAMCATPITAVVLGAVDPPQAGIASGVNNVVARLAALLGVAAVGGVAMALFTRTIDARRELAALSPSLRQALTAGRRSFSDVGLPASVPERDRPALQRLLDESFVASFRFVALLSAGIALGAGAAAAAVGTAEGLQGEVTMSVCTHLEGVIEVEPASRGCEECLRTGDRWVHLRLCLSCGHVGCCDSSKNRHATKHFRSSQHPIVRSLEPGEDWRWCYVDEIAV